MIGSVRARCFTLPLSAIAAALAWALAAPPSHADGALAVGNCGAFGYSLNYDYESTARRRALRECSRHKGRNCNVVTTFDGICMAFAVDNSGRCGAWGWATRPTRAEAEDVAVKECQEAGGESCRVQAQACEAPRTPAMTTNWITTELGPKECLERAEAVLKSAGLTEKLEVSGDSVWGEHGNYTAQVRCIAGKGVVMFLVVGPKLEEARIHLQAASGNF
jgi:hypothetical protein